MLSILWALFLIPLVISLTLKQELSILDNSINDGLKRGHVCDIVYISQNGKDQVAIEHDAGRGTYVSSRPDMAYNKRDFVNSHCIIVHATGNADLIGLIDLGNKLMFMKPVALLINGVRQWQNELKELEAMDISFPMLLHINSLHDDLANNYMLDESYLTCPSVSRKLANVSSTVKIDTASRGCQSDHEVIQESRLNVAFAGALPMLTNLGCKKVIGKICPPGKLRGSAIDIMDEFAKKFKFKYHLLPTKGFDALVANVMIYHHIDLVCSGFLLIILLSYS